MDARAVWALDNIDADIPCVGCGYNLRGLKTSGLCPECNEAVLVSLVLHRPQVDRLLLNADPKWLAQLSSGAACLTLAGLLGMGLSVFLLEFSWGDLAQETIRSVAGTVAWTFSLLGIWKLTRLPGGPRNGAGSAGDRLWRRATAWLVALFAFLPIVAASRAWVTHVGATNPAAPLLDVLMLMLLLVGALATTCLYMHLRQLASRMPRILIQIPLFLMSVLVPFIFIEQANHVMSHGTDATLARSLWLLPQLPVPPPNLCRDGIQNLASAIFEGGSFELAGVLMVAVLLALGTLIWITAQLMLIQYAARSDPAKKHLP